MLIWRNGGRSAGLRACALASLVVLTGLGVEPVQAQSPGSGILANLLQARLADIVAEVTGLAPGFEMAGHEAGGGPMLRSDPNGVHDAMLFGAAGCPQGVETKLYEFAAIRLRINLNRWGDHDPEGFMFAPIDALDEIAETSRRQANGNFGLSLGLAGDAIQPLTLRANVGDCIRLVMSNLLNQPTSFHVHGADLTIAATGEPALSTNPDSTALPGETVVYEWYVNPDHYRENTHYAHPHGPGARFQVSHGLFAAIIVEPERSEYFDQRTAAPLCDALQNNGVRKCKNSWDAMISPGEGDDFREFAMFYHEIGHENFVPINASGGFVPLFDPFTGTYKPAGRAINYRSESFLRRMREIEAQVPFYDNWHPDEALAYSSYAFGDPATPVPQSYLGDPAKYRLIHGGSEVFHVPHLHGGGVQWQRQAEMGKGEDNYVPLNGGLMKQFASSMPSSGNDSQSIGPSETYELEIGCGSGGCQQSVGDFLFHCHIASHYIAGMWHFWRVYNSLQDAGGKTDQLAVVAELPDRQGMVERAVTSRELIGRTVEFSGQRVAVDADTMPALVEAQLPPQGLPRDAQDAQVFDWVREGDLYLNEPETDFIWPNFRSSNPGRRPPLRFAADTGKLAWPFLRPHLGKRPPFAPHHGPAPYLAPLNHQNDAPPAPGANGAASLCPTEAPRRNFKIHAIQTPIRMAPRRVEPDGMLFVLKEHESQARADDEFKVPLAIRANQGDCVDVILINELDGVSVPGRELPEILKTNMHIHFVQFDVQASDGVPTGAAYEQAPRSFTHEGQATTVVDAVSPGATRVSVGDPSLFHLGSVIALGIDQPQEVFETATVIGFEENAIILAEPILNAHRPGEFVSAEFVRYRWYVARQNGAIYFHDHADALVRWGRGLFGALIAEPRDATFHDPRTGAEIRSGPIADIHTDREVVPGLDGSFREFVLFMTDRNPQTGSAINMRADPLFAGGSRLFGASRRGNSAADLIMSSGTNGDPVTPILRAYAGDPVMLRLLTTATEEIHPFTITGHQFRQERFQANSPLINSVGLGVSERFNGYIASAGGATKQAGDYLYYNGTERHFERGVWGLMRVFGALTTELLPLPGLDPPSASDRAQQSGDPCPSDAPVRKFSVSIIGTPSTIDDGSGSRLVNGRRYVLQSAGGQIGFLSDRDPPMVLRANAGDCVEIDLTNRAGGVAGMTIEGGNFNPADAYGAEIGRGGRRGLRPGESKIFRTYMAEELGIVRIRDFSRPFFNASLGLYGAIIVEPEGATYHDPQTDVVIESGVEAVVRLPDGSYFREFVMLFADRDAEIGTFTMPYDVTVDGDAKVNNRSTPLAPRIQRLGRRNLSRQAHLFTDEFAGAPFTPVFVAEAGEQIRMRVLSVFSEQPQVFSVEGHDWPLTPGLPGSDIVSSRLLQSGGALNLELRHAGGPTGRPGDYLWSNHRMPFLEAGQWGLLRILPKRPDAALGPRRDIQLFTQIKL